MAIVEEKKKNNNKWLWIGIGGALLFCLCAVAVAVFLLGRLGQKVKEGVKTDPVSAAEDAHKIADYDLPPGYREEMSMNFLVYSFVIITDNSATYSSDSRPMIMLAQFQAGVDQQQMEQQIQQSAEQQSGQRGFEMKLVETKTMTVRGEEVEVFIYEGKNESGDRMKQLATTFPGKDGSAMLMIMGDPQNWDQEEIDTFIKSIR